MLFLLKHDNSVEMLSTMCELYVCTAAYSLIPSGNYRSDTPTHSTFKPPILSITVEYETFLLNLYYFELHSYLAKFMSWPPLSFQMSKNSSMASQQEDIQNTRNLKPFKQHCITTLHVQYRIFCTKNSRLISVQFNYTGLYPNIIIQCCSKVHHVHDCTKSTYNSILP
jgi:hypothetical protein